MTVEHNKTADLPLHNSLPNLPHLSVHPTPSLAQTRIYTRYSYPVIFTHNKICTRFPSINFHHYSLTSKCVLSLPPSLPPHSFLLCFLQKYINEYSYPVIDPSPLSSLSLEAKRENLSPKTTIIRWPNIESSPVWDILFILPSVTKADYKPVCLTDFTCAL